MISVASLELTPMGPYPYAGGYREGLSTSGGISQEQHGEGKFVRLKSFLRGR